MVAVEPVQALVIPSPGFRAFVEQRPPVAVALMRMVVDRFRDTDRRLVDCIREVRDLMGPDVTMMVDFGYRWHDWRERMVPK